MNDINSMPPKCYDCPYWEIAEEPYVCSDCTEDNGTTTSHETNKIMSACGLESRPRWLNMGAIKGHRYNFMCSNCGEKVFKRILPKMCPKCCAEMMQD